MESPRKASQWDVSLSGNADKRVSSEPDMTSQIPGSSFTSYLMLIKWLASSASVSLFVREEGVIVWWLLLRWADAMGVLEAEWTLTVSD